MATIIRDEKKTDILLEKYYNRFNKYNTKILKELGETIKAFDGLTPSEAYKIGQELKYGYQLNDILRELSITSGKTIKEVSKILDETAKENVDFAEKYYKAKNEEFSPYEENEQFQNIVSAIKKETNNLFINISNSQNIGFTLRDNDGNMFYKPISKVYTDLIDEAVNNIAIGVKDYQSAMRNTIKQLADSGIKIHEEKIGFKNGYNRRIDSSVRQNILTGLRKVNIGIQEEIGKQLDTNGVEISAHELCAEDHLDIQGRQYTNKEFERINSELARPIGEYNCKHFIFSIILDVNMPSYTNKMLEQYRKESLSKVDYKGKTYTKYEATQIQRKLETEIRKQKDRQIIARASNDKIEVGKAQQKINQLTTEYNKFSQNAGLDTYKDRLSVTGYHRVKV